MKLISVLSSSYLFILLYGIFSGSLYGQNVEISGEALFFANEKIQVREYIGGVTKQLGLLGRLVF